MTAKEYLSQVIEQKKLIQKKLDKLEHLRSKATKTTLTLGSEGGSGVRKKDIMENSIIDFVELEKELAADTQVFMKLQDSILETISEFEDKQQRNILTLRYLGFKTWTEISKIMDCTDRQCRRIESAALRELFLTSECPTQK